VIYEREKESLVVRHANVEHYYLQPVSKTFMDETSSPDRLLALKRNGRRPVWEMK